MYVFPAPAMAYATLCHPDSSCPGSHPASLHIEFPMLFEISNVKEPRVSHCGVLEFVAEEGVAYMPYWVRAQWLASVRTGRALLVL